MERLDQAFRQSYYHTQQPNGQPFGACVGAASGGKMGAITLDFKESHHERTLPYKRTDPRVFHGTFSGGAVSGNDGEISAECTSVLAIFGRSARYEGYRYGLEKAPSERKKYSPSTVNASLAALNYLFSFLGWTDCRTHYLKIQRRLFRETGRELDRADYEKLIAVALGLGRERIALVMETICATGIRVGELRYITVEAVRSGSATISLKGKIRTILLPGKLCKKLLKYARKQKITSGEIFLTGGGKPMSRCQIWAEMKRICKTAGVDPTKVFPHNLRHLFATVYYRIYKDIVKLADILGHSSVETTRIYLLTTGTEHRQQLERLRLVL